MTKIESVAAALRDALIAYGSLESRSPARAVVAQRLFGAMAARTLLPQLDELARGVRAVEIVRK